MNWDVGMKGLDIIHKYHHEISREVKSWYTRTYLELGFIVRKRKYGFYRQNNKFSMKGQVLLQNLTPDQVEDFLKDLRNYYKDNSVQIFIDEDDLERQLRNNLIKNNCVKASENIYLAYTGDVPKEVMGLEFDIEPVEEKNIKDYVYTKLKGFANNEDEPSKEEELAIRTCELRSIGCFFIARIHQEPVATIAWYRNTRFPLIYSLATRVPFRNRGIAQLLIRKVILDSLNKGCKTVVINVDSQNPAVRLYKKLGFTDEVLRRHEYTWKS